MVRTTIIWSFFALTWVMLLVDLPSVIMPFFVSFILAYTLSPLMEWLQNKCSLPQSLAAFVVLSSFLILCICVMTLLLPLIYSQISILIKKIPTYQTYVNEVIVPYISGKLHSVDSNVSTSAKNAISQSVDNIFEFFVSMLDNIWSYTMATIHVIVMIFLIPVLLFYFLRDWRKMKDSFYSMFPTASQKFVINIFSDINDVLSAYIRGQLLICVIWVIYYYIALSSIGIDLALILAAISGITPIVPIVGTIIAVSITMIVGYFTFGMEIQLVYITIFYVFGGIADSSFITPKIIGDSLGLSPVWIVFAVLVLGYLMGPIGMLIGIPVAGIISVILKYANQDYKNSQFYKLKK